MTEQDWIELGKRAVACEGWRWRVGMAARLYTPELGWREWRVNRSSWLSRARGNVAEIDMVANISPGYRGPLPDFRDPATVGCLLVLVRETLGAPHVHAEYASFDDGQGWWVCGCHRPGRESVITKAACCTEAEALVAALEAAPKDQKR